jgi:uncharacterized protein (TIGR03086 family)
VTGFGQILMTMTDLHDTTSATSTTSTTATSTAADRVAADGSRSPAAEGSAGPDPRPLLASAAESASSVIAGVTSDQLALPTPCAAFDVDGLLEHLLMVSRRIAALGNDGDAFAPGIEDSTGLSLIGLQSTWTSSISEALSAWDDEATLHRTMVFPWATLPGAAVAVMYTSELLVHAWDLARATNQHVEFADDAVGASLGFMKMALPAEGRDAAEMPFSPVVTVPPTATLIDQLVAWTGRDPSMQGLSR